MIASPNKNVKRLSVKQKRTLVQLSVAQKQRVVLFATQNKDLLELSENEKEFTPLTVTQAIVYI
jgi:hypothetical protein